MSDQSMTVRCALCKKLIHDPRKLTTRTVGSSIEHVHTNWNECGDHTHDAITHEKRKPDSEA
jgi:hypothetical protein